jgi:hypothetical protein
VIGATMILAIGAATTHAQAKSSKRIPISKEAPGEVARVDTVVRVDTITVTNTMYHTDTLVRTETRVDSVMLPPPPPPPIILPAGFYVGAAFGSSMPTGSIFTPNSMGYIGQFHLGWQNAKQMLGARISGTYTGLGQDSRFSDIQGSRARLWTLGTDLKLNAPLGRVWGRTPKLAAYAIGGWTYTWYQHLPFELNTDNVAVVNPNTGNVFIVNDNNNINNVFTTGADGSWHGQSGWDVGGGLSLSWRNSELFVESRVMGFRPHIDSNILGLNNGNINGLYAHQVPFIVGYNIY